MAYIVYYYCDKCNRVGGYWENETTAVKTAKSIARCKGWQVGKRGWICPKCISKKLSGGKSG